MNLVTRFFKVFFWTISHLRDVAFGLENAMYAKRGTDYANSWNYQKGDGLLADTVDDVKENRLKTYFDANTEGHGLFKFYHYFDAYDRHFSKFVGKEVHVVEVGVWSGGSLKMWQSYFGDKCKVYGVDIHEACRVYESESVKIFIGDQESRDFWKEFKKKVPRVDILIDDGGHLAEQQIATLEEILPHISPGGVYFCEDVSGSRMKLTAYINGIQNELNTINSSTSLDHINSKATPFQQQIHSVHQYPYIFVIEKQSELVDELIAPQHGTIWGPVYNPEGSKI